MQACALNNFLRMCCVRMCCRLNEAETYDRQDFITNGINHVDLYFDDCTVPPPEIVFPPPLSLSPPPLSLSSPASVPLSPASVSLSPASMLLWCLCVRLRLRLRQGRIHIHSPKMSVPPGGAVGGAYPLCPTGPLGGPV